MPYKVEYFMRHYEGDSAHMVEDLEALLNKRQSEGWVLAHMFHVPIGWVLVFDCIES